MPPTDVVDTAKTVDATKTVDQTKTGDQAAADAIAAASAAAADKTKTDDAAKTAADAEAAKAAAAKSAVVYTLALPTGAVLEASAIERTTAFAKATGLAPDAAQHALNHANAEVAADRVRQQEMHAAQFKKMAFEDWPAQVKEHPKYGGEQHTNTIINVKRLADKVIAPYPERVEALNRTGWGNHPLLVEIFADIGAMMADDNLVQGGAGGGVEKKDAATLLYGGTKKPG